MRDSEFVEDDLGDIFQLLGKTEVLVNVRTSQYSGCQRFSKRRAVKRQEEKRREEKRRDEKRREEKRERELR